MPFGCGTFFGVRFSPVKRLCRPGPVFGCPGGFLPGGGAVWYSGREFEVAAGGGLGSEGGGPGTGVVVLAGEL